MPRPLSRTLVAFSKDRGAFLGDMHFTG